MRKPKRKYIRKVLPPESISNPIKRESNSKILPVFSFSDLPLSIRSQIEGQIAYRKRLKLPDDSKERKAQAVRMFRGERPR